MNKVLAVFFCLIVVTCEAFAQGKSRGWIRLERGGDHPLASEGWDRFQIIWDRPPTPAAPRRPPSPAPRRGQGRLERQVKAAPIPSPPSPPAAKSTLPLPKPAAPEKLAPQVPAEKTEVKGMAADLGATLVLLLALGLVMGGLGWLVGRLSASQAPQQPSQPPQPVQQQPTQPPERKMWEHDPVWFAALVALRSEGPNSVLITDRAAYFYNQKPLPQVQSPIQTFQPSPPSPTQGSSQPST